MQTREPGLRGAVTARAIQPLAWRGPWPTRSFFTKAARGPCSRQPVIEGPPPTATSREGHLGATLTPAQGTKDKAVCLPESSASFRGNGQRSASPLPSSQQSRRP